ncbi:hypothetical protein I3760_15G086100 [Carya illinoinensis]|nr:hypothetical protein I3760_15G086100 [Carya illinoinensis]
MKRRADEAENVPISLDLDSVWCKRDETPRQIRTNPPSPQCSSATRGWSKTTVSMAVKSKLMLTSLAEQNQWAHLFSESLSQTMSNTSHCYICMFTRCSNEV